MGMWSLYWNKALVYLISAACDSNNKENKTQMLCYFLNSSTLLSSFSSSIWESVIRLSGLAGLKTYAPPLICFYWDGWSTNINTQSTGEIFKKVLFKNTRIPFIKMRRSYPSKTTSLYCYGPSIRSRKCKGQSECIILGNWRKPEIILYCRKLQLNSRNISSTRFFLFNVQNRNYIISILQSHRY